MTLLPISLSYFVAHWESDGSRNNSKMKRIQKTTTPMKIVRVLRATQYNNVAVAFIAF